MKLILSVEALSPNLSGIGRYAWELASRMPRAANIEHVLFFRNGRWVDNPETLLLPSEQHSQKRHRKAFHLPFRMPVKFRQAGLRWKCNSRIFHGPNYFLPPYADLGVVTIHDLSVFKFPETHPIERIKQFERDFNRSVNHALHLITDSEATRQELIAFLGITAEQVTAVPLGVSSKFRPRNARETENLQHRFGIMPGMFSLCVSTLEPRKKIGNLLLAYRCLPKNVRDQFPLVLAGGAGWLNETLHQQIMSFVEEGWLRYLGFVSEGDLHLLYAGARSFLYPSAYEGFGLPVLEAMASGVPVVAANRSSLPEITQEAALLIDPNDINDLRSGIERSLTDEDWRSASRELGLRIAQCYTWEKCIEKTIKVYEKVLAK